MFKIWNIFLFCLLGNFNHVCLSSCGLTVCSLITLCYCLLFVINVLPTKHPYVRPSVCPSVYLVCSPDKPTAYKSKSTMAHCRSIFHVCLCLYKFYAFYYLLKINLLRLIFMMFFMFCNIKKKKIKSKTACWILIKGFRVRIYCILMSAFKMGVECWLKYIITKSYIKII